MAVPVTITLHGQSQCILDKKGEKIDLQERSLNRKRISHTKTKVITLPNCLSPRNRSSKLCENTKNSQLFTLTPRVINLIQTKNKKEKKIEGTDRWEAKGTSRSTNERPRHRKDFAFAPSTFGDLYNALSHLPISLYLMACSSTIPHSSQPNPPLFFIFIFIVIVIFLLFLVSIELQFDRKKVVT